MKQLSLAVASYHDSHGHFPPPYVLGPDGTPWHSWRVLILPYLSDNDLYEQYDMNQPWNSEHNLKLLPKIPNTYVSYSRRDGKRTATSYLAVVGPDTVWPGDRKIKTEDVFDGSSVTIQIVENEGLNIPWTEPRDLNFADMPFTLNHPQGINSPYKAPAVTRVDGSVLRLDPKMPANVLRALLTRHGKEVVDFDSATWEKIPDGRIRELAK
ncbi:MAG: DUF1559 domain-containing protein [Fimbriiglobus sp.]